MATDLHGINRAHRAVFRLATSRGESIKIVSADEMVCRSLQNLEIKRRGYLPDSPVLKGRQHRRRPDSVAINFSFGGMARMKTRCHITEPKHAKSRREQCIERARPTRR